MDKSKFTVLKSNLGYAGVIAGILMKGTFD